MPPNKSPLKITIECNGKKFSLNCSPVMFDRWRVKNGRSWSKKVGLVTLTEIFNLARKWTVKNV